MKMIAHNPTDGVYPATEDYVHAMEVRDADRMLFVSGTMGLDANGVAGKCIDEQLELIWSNLNTILKSAGMSLNNVVRLTSYLTDPAYAEANASARVKALGNRPIPTTAIVAQTLVPEWLIEIEVTAVD